jgi:hypothetical protein
MPFKIREKDWLWRYANATIYSCHNFISLVSHVILYFLFPDAETREDGMPPSHLTSVLLQLESITLSPRLFSHFQKKKEDEEQKVCHRILSYYFPDSYLVTDSLFQFIC